MSHFASKCPASVYLITAVVLSISPSILQADLKTSDTRDYIIHSDLDGDGLREAAIRLTRMADEYRARTRGFAGQVTEKFPFYLYRSETDYIAAGGLSGTAGVFIPDGKSGKLLAIAGDKPNLRTWHTIQHEGFHQFAHAAIGDGLPVWLNEGLAEYFAEAIFTGDSYQSGVIPPWRLARLKQEISSQGLHPLPDLFSLTGEEWQQEMSIANYDQAWSLVHYLVHADDGKYQEPLAACIRNLAEGKPFNQAWLQTLGPADGLESRWKSWWCSQPDHPTSVLYQQATIATLTSYLARATASGQTFETSAQFFTAADRGQLKINDNDWLPQSLLNDYLPLAKEISQWQLAYDSEKQPMLIATLPDRSQLIGSFKLKDGRVDRIIVQQKKR